MMKILVTYASKHQATADIAAHIAKRLRLTGLMVELLPVEDVNDPTPYDVVVIGSAVYAGNWMSSAVKFLKTHAPELSLKPVWVFSSGPTGEGDPETLLKGWVFPDALQETMERIAPKEIKLFHGKLDLDQLSWGERLIIKTVKAAKGDFRDWREISAWGDTIAHTIKMEFKAGMAEDRAEE